MPEPTFRGGNVTDLSPHPDYFLQGHSPPFVESRNDRFLQPMPEQFQSAEACFPGPPYFPATRHHGSVEQHLTSGGIVSADSSRFRGTNSWIEAEREMSLQQQRRAAGIVDRFPPVYESGELFPPKTLLAEAPRVEDNDNMLMKRKTRGSSPQRRGFGFRGDFYQVSEEVKTGKDAKRQTSGIKFPTGIAKGRNQLIPSKEGLLECAQSRLTNAGELHEDKGQVSQADDFTQGPYTFPGSYSQDGAEAFAPETAQNLEVARVPRSGPGHVSVFNDFENKVGPKREVNGVSKREEILKERGLLTPHIRDPISREEELLHQHGLQLKTAEMRVAVQMQQGMEPTFQKKSLKRKHPMSVQQPISREEELLIEKGLLDDDDSSSESPMRQPFPYQRQQVNDQSVLRSKQGGLEEEEFFFKPIGYRSSYSLAKREVKGMNLDQLDEQHQQKMQLSRIQNETTEKQGNVTDKVVGAKFSRSAEERLTSWQIEVSSDRHALRDIPVDSEELRSHESLHVRGWNPSQSIQPIESHHLLQARKMEQQEVEGGLQNKDVLHRQYQNWEAEEQHMEAVKRAEKLAREIQQRDESMQQMGSLQSAQRHDVSVQQQLPHGNRDQFNLQNQEMMRFEGSQPQPEINMLQHNLVLQSLTLPNSNLSQHSSQQRPVSQQQPFSQQLNYYSQRPVRLHEAQPQKQVLMAQLSHNKQEDGWQQQSSFQQDHELNNVLQKPPIPPQQSFLNLPSSLQQHPREALARERQELSQPYEGWQSWHQDSLDQFPASSSQLQKNHSDAQPSHINSHVRQEVTQHQGQPQHQLHWQNKQQQPSQHQLQPEHYQHVPHQNQQPTSSQAGQPYYAHFVTQEVSRETVDGSANHGILHQVGHYQSGSGTHELHSSFPPLPTAASVDPPPPNSPPPPPPSSAHHPPDAPPPPPPVSTTFPSAGPPVLQGSSGHSQSYQLQPAQNLPSQSQSFGPQELHYPQQLGMHFTSQVPVSHVGIHPSQFPSHPPQQLEKSRVVDAVNIFRNPGRMMRPDRFVVILRGLPGSGKSYLAKALRDVEVMNGGSAPRIHSMDDYFMCEVEKVDEVEMGSSSLRSKKKVVKSVMEYCYEPEMEEAYRASMLKAFRKTLEEGMFKFAIVDDRNVLIADFSQFWAIAKRSGYEVYILEAPYTDVKGCAARNVHNFTEQQIQSMADRWESTPQLYLRLDVSSLFRGDDLSAQDIIEVEMDAEDMEHDLEEEEEDFQSSQERVLGSSSQMKEKPILGDRWEDKGDPAQKAAAAPNSKKHTEDHKSGRGNTRKSTDNALSGLMTTYGKKDKFVHWSDNQGVKGNTTGFSIGSASQKRASLVIGPGPGYNGNSNPVIVGADKNLLETELRRSNKFVEQLRAEQEAFKAVFARRRQRIHGMDDEDDD